MGRLMNTLNMGDSPSLKQEATKNILNLKQICAYVYVTYKIVD